VVCAHNGKRLGNEKGMKKTIRKRKKIKGTKDQYILQHR
jgi:hypothetical protein